MKSTTLQAMDEALEQYAELLMKVLKIIDAMTDEINAVKENVYTVGELEKIMIDLGFKQ